MTLARRAKKAKIEYKKTIVGAFDTPAIARPLPPAPSPCIVEADFCALGAGSGNNLFYITIIDAIPPPRYG